MTNDTTICYKNICDAEEFFTPYGFIKRDVPWLVSKEASDATKPNEGKDLYVLDADSDLGFLPASGEQSFIEMMIEGTLSEGLYQCTTPCFRIEDAPDDLHRLSFMKTELIIYGINDSTINLRWLLGICRDYFGQYFDGEITIVLTEIGFDLVTSQGIELGSYGERRWSDPYGKEHTWIYGTGCAEPRLSQAVKIYKDSKKETFSR